MKRAIVMSVLGAAACFMANTAHAQGSVVFCNYTGGLANMAPVTYSGAAFGSYTDGMTIGTPFTADLLYSLDGGATWSDSGVTAGFLTPSGTPVASGGGFFGSTATQATIAAYSSGAIDFMVQVYNGSSYATSSVFGESGVISCSVLSTPSNKLAVGSFFDSNATSPLTAFTVAAIPEPTTMAFGAMGLLSLLAMARRKKA